MTRKSFLIDPLDLDAQEVTLRDDSAHHIRNVLRLKPGDHIELRDGKGSGCRAMIQEVRSGHVRVGLRERLLPLNESPLQLTLALAFSRFDRMELVLRQATEMGIHRFAAFGAERSGYDLSASRMDRRKERWSKIAREALCQCGRMMLPEILLLGNTAGLISAVLSWEKKRGNILKVLAREDGYRESLSGLKRVHPFCRELLVVVGPEGGWTEVEREHFADTGFHSVHLGPRTLRLETAALGLLAAVQFLWGDLGAQAESLGDPCSLARQNENSI
jgi:16S rRNA (uracil1498-N3)-methyltransferase